MKVAIDYNRIFPRFLAAAAFVVALSATGLGFLSGEAGPVMPTVLSGAGPEALIVFPPLAVSGVNLLTACAWMDVIRRACWAYAS